MDLSFSLKGEIQINFIKQTQLFYQEINYFKFYRKKEEKKNFNFFYKVLNQLFHNFFIVFFKNKLKVKSLMYNIVVLMIIKK
jgi:hypothetical protein